VYLKNNNAVVLKSNDTSLLPVYMMDWVV